MPADPRTFIRSLTRGRARLRHEVLKGLSQEDVDGLTQMVLATPGVTAVTFNPRVGSALILWDESQTSAEELLGMAAFLIPDGESGESAGAAPQEDAAEATPGRDAGCPCLPCRAVRAGLRGIAAAGGAALDALRPFVAPDVKTGGRGRRVTQNRLMLAACAASLGVLVLKTSRSAMLHTALGGLFCGLLVIHLLQHRTVL